MKTTRVKHIEEKKGKMHKNVPQGICLLCLIFLLLAGCTGIEDERNLEIEKGFPGLTDQNSEWVKMVNSRSPLDAYYHSSAVMLFENEWYLTQEEIVNKLHDFEIKRRGVLRIHEHSRSQIFEVGEYTLSDDSVLTYLTAYSKQDDMWLRQLEVLYQKADRALDRQASDDMMNGIEQKWEELIISKDAKQLVDTLFWEDARYVNLVNGDYTDNYEELLNVYRFIERPDISFSVKILDHYVVRDDVVFIIGQYQTGPQQGYYTLIHTKNEHNVWKNTLDTNY